MRFEQALMAMREGKKVKRPCYYTEFLIANNDIRYVQKIEEKEYEFSFYGIGCKDIMSEDWEIVEDEPQS